MSDIFSSKNVVDGSADQRSAPRKPLKTRAVLTVRGAEPLAVRTLDISINGVCLSFFKPMPIGLAGRLSIDLMIEGKVNTIDVQAKAAYCIFSNGQYKVGFQFTGVDMATVTLLAKFMR